MPGPQPPLREGMHLLSDPSRKERMGLVVMISSPVVVVTSKNTK